MPTDTIEVSDVPQNLAELTEYEKSLLKAYDSGRLALHFDDKSIQIGHLRPDRAKLPFHAQVQIITSQEVPLTPIQKAIITLFRTGVVLLDPNNITVLKKLVDVTRTLIADSGASATIPAPVSPAKSEEPLMPLSPAPTFEENKPWHIESITVENGKVLVKILDSSNTEGTLEFDRAHLKLIQDVGSTDIRKLYAEIRPGRKGLFLGPSHQIVYLGDIDKNDFPRIKKQLDSASIDYVWYPDPRTEKLSDLLPKAWKASPHP